MGLSQWTAGTLLFSGGIAGMAIVLATAVIVSLCLRHSGRKIKNRLEAFYRDNSGGR